MNPSLPPHGRETGESLLDSGENLLCRGSKITSAKASTRNRGEGDATPEVNHFSNFQEKKKTGQGREPIPSPHINIIYATTTKVKSFGGFFRFFRFFPEKPPFWGGRYLAVLALNI